MLSGTGDENKAGLTEDLKARLALDRVVSLSQASTELVTESISDTLEAPDYANFVGE